MIRLSNSSIVGMNVSRETPYMRYISSDQTSRPIGSFGSRCPTADMRDALGLRQTMLFLP